MTEQSAPAASQKGAGIHLLLGILVSLAIAALSWSHFYEDQEASIYDLRFLLRNDLFGEPYQLPAVSTVDIDDDALQAHGFPFPRDRHAALVDILNQYDAKMIGFDIFFYEPSPAILSPDDVSRLEQDTLTKDEVIALIQDYDRDFLRAAQSGDIVYLAQTFEITESGADFARENLRERSEDVDAALVSLARSSVPLDAETSENLYHATDMEVPLPPFVDAVRGVGFALPKPDHDGIVRRYRLVLAYDGRLYFSLGFIMACDYLNVPLEKVRLIPGSHIELPDARLPDGSTSDVRVPVTGRREMLVNWAGTYHNTFRHLPFNMILDFAETEPENRALKIAKRVAHNHPQAMQDDGIYLERAAEEGGAGLDPDLLLQMKYVVFDCQQIESALSDDPELTVERFAGDMGVPEEEIPAVAEVLGAYFGRIKINLRIYDVLKKSPELSLAQIGERLGVSRLEDIQLGVGVIRDLMRRSGDLGPEDHPLFFLDRLTSAGLHGEKAADRIVTAEDFQGTAFFYGLTATGTHDLNPTPFGAREAMLGAHVNVFNTIVTQNFLSRIPKWANALVMLGLGLLIGILVPRFRALPGALVVLGLLVVYLVASFLLFARSGIWVDVFGPVGTLVIGYLSITLYNYVQKEKEKEFVQGAFGHYLDPKVVDQLVENPDLINQLGGDQRVMTAFFSDIASFSTMSENLTPLELVELLNEYLTEMCDLVAEHGGTIDKFEGDAILAFYGAPIKSEDHAIRAVLAAVDMQNKITELREGWETKGKMEQLRKLWSEEGMGEFFRVRMGVNTGEMVVGNMGSHTRVDYTIMGDAVNLASRLEGAGKAYGVCTMIGEATYRATAEAIDVRELDSIQVVGRDEAVRVYEILDRKGEADPKKQEVADIYAEGLGLYRERRWDDAIERFNEGLRVDPEDGPCKVFIERAETCKQVPPPEDWDAVHELESK
ncbi:MAG: adenylate/guanylate cyclase domain-containing protein [Candidatus Latescibacteria bacterium]|jgi:adenylate cyclase|nr:adenylate/guanylate cyclase domain-containing protein [Candidatus Latescibacterota bacterium]